MRLDGRCVVLTDAASGLGRAIARALCGAGADVTQVFAKMLVDPALRIVGHEAARA